MKPESRVGRGIRLGSLRAAEAVPWSFAVLAIALFPLLGAVGFGVEFLPWVVGTLFFGLPHGACDHLVAARLTGRDSRMDLVLFVSLYLSLSLVVVALWFIDAGAALVAFLLITAWHWGSADAAATRPTQKTPLHFLSLSLARGTLVISAPVAFHTESSWSAFAAVMNVFEDAPPTLAPGWLFPLACVALIFASLVEISLPQIPKLDKTRATATKAIGRAELSLLLCLFLFVQPVAAVGVYFVFWHAWRHVLRVGELLFHDHAQRERSLKNTVLDYHVKAVPLTLISFAGIVIVAALSQSRSLPELLGTYLVIISALTLPHAVMVTIWDFRLKLHHR